MMPVAWLRYQQDLALAAFVAGCSIAEMQLRLALSFIRKPTPRRPALRLVSDMHGILVEGPSP